MRKLAGWLLLGLVLISATSKTAQKNQQIYQNKTFAYEFRYPQTWKIEKGQAKDGYVALFDPRALSLQDLTLELVTGIKLEFISLKDKNEEKAMLQGYKPFAQLANEKTELAQYYLLIDDCLIVVTPIRKNDSTTLILAYLPVKEQIKEYLPKYNEIVLSFRYLKNS